MTPKVFIGLPTYDSNFLVKLHFRFKDEVSVNYDHEIRVLGSSFLTYGFNQLWAMMLNKRSEGFTHFVLHHADIVPEAFWLDKMMPIMDLHMADVLSAVSPIKSMDGLTSTALDRSKGNLEDPRDSYLITRLTMKNIYAEAQTFTHPKLLLNTGLMMVDFRKSWVEQIRFHVENDIKKIDGKWTAMAMSEDWLFSRHAKALGAKLFVTREIGLEHIGPHGYDNKSGWGSLEYDTK